MPRFISFLWFSSDLNVSEDLKVKPMIAMALVEK